MGILDEDVARVREATDLVALAGEHIALEARRPPLHRPVPVPHARRRRRSRSTPRWACATASVARRAATRSRSSARSSISTSSKRSSGSRRAPASRCATTTRRSPKDRKRKQRLHEAVGAAIDFYHELLLESADAGNARAVPAQPRLRRRRRRGSSRSASSPDGYDALSRHLQKKKFSRDDIVDAGLAFVNRRNKLQDQFRGRLMFPIWDARGEPVGFGGRTLDGQGPKYKNSPETPIYQKSRLLYGLALGEGRDRRARRGRHLRGLHRRDGVRARRRAERGRDVRHRARRRPLPHAEEPRAQGHARVRRRRRRPGRGRAVLPVGAALRGAVPGRRPAGRARSRPTCGATIPRRWSRAVKGATPFLEFRIDRLLGARRSRRRSKVARARGRAAAALIAEHPNDLVRDQYVMKLAGRLDIDPDRLRDDRGARARTSAHVEPRNRPRGRDADGRVVDRRELDALRWAVHAPELMSGRLDVDAVRRPGRAERVRRADAAGRGTSASSRRRPRSRRCCSGSRSKSRERARRLPRSRDTRRGEPRGSIKSAAARVDAATAATNARAAR